MKNWLVKGFLCLGSLLVNSAFALLFFLASSIKYVILGEKVLLKPVILAGYAVLIWSGLRHPVLFAVLLGIILAVAFLFASLMVFYNGTESEEKNACTHTGSRIPFFEGMTAEMAKKEYRRLMKEYHPDNAGGDVAMTQKVIAAYQRYQMVNGSK